MFKKKVYERFLIIFIMWNMQWKAKIPNAECKKKLQSILYMKDLEKFEAFWKKKTILADARRNENGTKD